MFGNNPIVQVDITGVSLSALNPVCSTGSNDVIGHLKSYNLAHLLLDPNHDSCGRCKQINFSRRDGNVATKDGDWIKDNYEHTHGVKIYAHTESWLSYILSGKARIFNTSKTTGILGRLTRAVVAKESVREETRIERRKLRSNWK